MNWKLHSDQLFFRADNRACHWPFSAILAISLVCNLPIIFIHLSPSGRVRACACVCVFVCIQGLETLVRRQASRVSVVSQGAELIFISKKLFLQHANIRVLRIVNDMVCGAFRPIKISLPG